MTKKARKGDSPAREELGSVLSKRGNTAEPIQGKMYPGRCGVWLKRGKASEKGVLGQASSTTIWRIKVKGIDPAYWTLFKTLGQDLILMLGGGAQKAKEAALRRKMTLVTSIRPWQGSLSQPRSQTCKEDAPGKSREGESVTSRAIGGGNLSGHRSQQAEALPTR